MNVTHGRLVCLLLWLVSVASQAHDFWIEAEPFYTSPGDTVELSLHVGNEFVGDTFPNVAAQYLAFNSYQPGKQTEVPGSLGRDPAGYLQIDQTGTHLIGYQSTFQLTRMDPETFLKYLESEGLDQARGLYLEAGNTVDKVSEQFKRHAKSLVQSGAAFSRDDSRLEIGYELELVPEENPYRLKPGDRLGLQLLYQGQPAEGIQVSAFSKTEPQHVQQQTTDATGRVSVTLDRAGPWLIKAVQINHRPNLQPAWESHWASLTFSIIP
jgi:uncharacterized GH25 family protein